MSSFKDTDVDTLILGCTHFPMIQDTIQRVVGKDVTLINPALETAISAQEMLKERDLLNDRDIEVNEEGYRFYVSDAPARFERVADMFLPLGIGGAKQVAIEEY